MGFELILQAFLDGDAGPGNRGDTEKVLSSYQASAPDEFGFRKIAFPDGSTFAFTCGAEGEPLSCLIESPEFSDSFFSFLLSLMEQGEMVLFVPGEDFSGGALVLMPSSGVDRNDFPDDAIFEQPMVVEDIKQLEALLISPLKGWESYRDRVLQHRP